MVARRRRGSGSIFLRGDGLWVGRIQLASGRKQVTSTRFCETLRRFSELHPYRAEFSIPLQVRAEAMLAARERGSHTAKEWHALVVAVNRHCFYCGIQCNSWNRPSQRITKDHRMPVSRGGSDAIENIVVACKRCNSEKSNLTDEEYLAMRTTRPEPSLR